MVLPECPHPAWLILHTISPKTSQALAIACGRLIIIPSVARCALAHAHASSSVQKKFVEGQCTSAKLRAGARDFSSSG